jgi:glucose-6-phosphate isomerase
MAANELWDRYRAWLCDAPEPGFWLDVSRMDVPGDLLRSMDEPVRRALAAMEALEGGAIAIPDEKRMVGHYWLRAPEGGTAEELAAAAGAPGEAETAFHVLERLAANPSRGIERVPGPSPFDAVCRLKGR